MGDCEGVPPPCVEREEAHTAATIVLILAIAGGVAWTLSQVGEAFGSGFH